MSFEKGQKVIFNEWPDCFGIVTKYESEKKIWLTMYWINTKEKRASGHLRADQLKPYAPSNKEEDADQ